LSTDCGSIEHFLGLISLLLCLISDERIPLAAVVGIGNVAESLKLSLKIFLGSLGGNSIDKELATLFSKRGHFCGDIPH